MSAAPDMSAQEMPTVVLIHGAFAGSSSWNGVIANLKRRGYPVIAVANPLRGVQKDAAYVRALLDSLPGPVVMAAHSYGGLVMTEAAAGAANVKALVYVASVSPDVGESVIGLLGKYPGSQLATSIKMVPIPSDDGGTTMISTSCRTSSPRCSPPMSTPAPPKSWRRRSDRPRRAPRRRA